MMQLVAEVDIPQHPELQEVTIDEKELKKLKKAKLINLELYVLLAVRIDYGQKSSVGLHTETFCKKWKLCSHELGAAIAKLQKKGLMDCEDKPFIQLELFELKDE